MSTPLKSLAADVRRLWTTPGDRRAWGRDTVAIVRLLKAIEDEPEPVDVGKFIDEEISAADRMRDGEVSDHPQMMHDGRGLGDALRRVRARLR